MPGIKLNGKLDPEIVFMATFELDFVSSKIWLNVGQEENFARNFATRATLNI